VYMEEVVKDFLVWIGEEPNREGLKDTPKRVVKMYEELTAGYRMKLSDIINNAIFYEETIKDMIVLKDIDFFSLCEHHILPFFGKCHIGYIPRKKIIGISKLARIVEMYSKRLQLQERLTNQIASTIYEVLEPLGVGVVVEATHLCMVMRGIKKQNARMITSSMLGVFRENISTRSEFLSLISRDG